MAKVEEMSRRELLAKFEPKPSSEDPRAVVGTSERRELLAKYPNGVGDSKWPAGIPDEHGNVLVCPRARA